MLVPAFGFMVLKNSVEERLCLAGEAFYKRHGTC
jgi:hypothetical protein